MVSYEERREVDVKALVDAARWYMLYLDYSGDSLVKDALKDLIHVIYDECGVDYSKTGGSWPVSPIPDIKALLAMADQLDKSLGWCEPDKDGCVRVKTANLQEVTRRIRRACGKEGQ